MLGFPKGISVQNCDFFLVISMLKLTFWVSKQSNQESDGTETSVEAEKPRRLVELLGRLGGGWGVVARSSFVIFFDRAKMGEAYWYRLGLPK